MTSEISLDDFLDLALRLRETAVTHHVPSEHRASLIEDSVFQFAAFLDERLGSSFHESIFGLLEDHAEALAREPDPVSPLLAQLEITFGKGRKKEANILRGHLREEQFLREVVEFALGLRSLDEIDAEIDSDARFTRLMATKNGIRSLRFNSAANIGSPSWLEVLLEGSEYGTFDQSLEGLCSCISRVTRQWI